MSAGEENSIKEVTASYQLTAPWSDRRHTKRRSICYWRCTCVLPATRVANQRQSIMPSASAWDIEPDLRHAPLIISESGCNSNAKRVSTPREKLQDKLVSEGSRSPILNGEVVVDNDTTVHDVHTHTVAFSPSALIKCSICPHHPLMRTLRMIGSRKRSTACDTQPYHFITST